MDRIERHVIAAGKSKRIDEGEHIVIALIHASPHCLRQVVDSRVGHDQEVLAGGGPKSPIRRRAGRADPAAYRALKWRRLRHGAAAASG